MANQLNLLPKGQIIPTALHSEMQQSYLEYAMSVIVGRALPDVRDGLKPVHRRILYAMHELGLTPDRPYRKCARVVGDVLGKYHPHGDQAVYDALVRMVQDFSTRYPLLGGHGNFGSIDDDPPAAMRYTETRLAGISHDCLLENISEATVNFIGNFDNSQQEPTVLPAQLPFLLLNGSSGIAVGMATNIPPHNLTEVVDGLIALIDRPTLSDEQLLDLIPGPDFPTGGEIIGQEGIREMYTNGRGSVTMRGIAQIEEVSPGRGRQRRTAIIVTELPYQVNKAAWIEKVADLVNQGRIEGIVDIRDESDRDGMRVVIELKREANPQKILHLLYKQTALQANFGAILLALVDGQPCQLSLRQLLQNFLDFREATLTRHHTHEFQRAESRLHVVEGLLTALAHLDDIIEILRHAPDGTTARQTLQERYALTERQAGAILSMPLRQLTGMERQNLQTEFENLTAQMADLRRLLDDRHELLKALKKELRALKKKYGDTRRTRMVTSASGKATASGEGDLEGDSEGALEGVAEEAEMVVLELTHRGYARRLSTKTFQRQQRTRNSGESVTVAEDTQDFVSQAQTAFTDQELVVLTRDGKAYAVQVGEIPAGSGRAAKGAPLVGLLPESVQGNPDAIVSRFIMPDELEDLDLVMLSRQGRMKRVPLEEFVNMTGRGLVAMKLKDDDELMAALLAYEGEQLVLATSGGRVLRFEINEEELPVMGRTAQGVQMIRLRRQEELVGCVVLEADQNLILMTRQAYAKQIPVQSLRLTHRGEIGAQAFHFTVKGDAVLKALPVTPEAELGLLTSNNRFIRLLQDQVPVQTKEDGGSQLVSLTKNETIAIATDLLPVLFEQEE
ncbi:MAG: DNA gyrase subunit A [Leptolyngbyaceae cyanobacterium bins.59]|nr:DNA gyrase subunit A [Leptolyngbyaceae cyanobacterium bins.59]